MALYIGIDAGGTKTRYALANEEKILAIVDGASIKRLRVDEATAEAQLDTALGSLQKVAGVSLADVTSTCIGTAGEKLPIVQDFLQRALRERVAGRLILLGDIEIALEAAFPGSPGLLILAGTGSNVAARGSDLKIHTAGGWGPVLGDAGSGYQLGYQTLRAAFHSIDQGEPSIFLEHVAKAWSLPTREALVERANQKQGADFANLAPLVAHCMRLGDRVSESVVRQQAFELASQALLLLTRVHLGDASPSVAFAGSIAEQIPEFRQMLIDHLRANYGSIQAMEGTVDPLFGALSYARNQSPNPPFSIMERKTFAHSPQAV